MQLTKYFSLSVWALEAWSPMPATTNSITTVNGTISFTHSALSFPHHNLLKMSEKMSYCLYFAHLLKL